VCGFETSVIISGFSFLLTLVFCSVILYRGFYLLGEFGFRFYFFLIFSFVRRMYGLLFRGSMLVFFFLLGYFGVKEVYTC